jgi:hypothetical protein
LAVDEELSAAGGAALAGGARLVEDRHDRELTSPVRGRTRGARPRVAFVGLPPLLDRMAPCGPQKSFCYERFPAEVDGGRSQMPLGVEAYDGDVVVVLDPLAFDAKALESLAGTTLGVLPGPPRGGEQTRPGATLDRLVCFDPALTGAVVGGEEVWRAVPPPVSDAFYDTGRALHRAPRVMSVGRSTLRREEALMPAKHQYDVLQIIHGVEGPALAALLREYDVGIHLGGDRAGEFEWQAGLHLAAGHLLLSEPLHPAHGLELNIDYLRFETPEELLHLLGRLASFPEMGRRVQVRGRLKGEHFRASRIFGRLVEDVLLDVAAFGSARSTELG